MKEPYPKYLLEDHDFELVESKVNHNLGGYDYSVDVFECSVCDYRKTDNYRELTENGIYGSLDNHASIENMSSRYMSKDGNIALEIYSYEIVTTTYYVKIEHQEDGYLYLKRCRTVSGFGGDYVATGDLELLDSNKNEVDVPNYYANFEKTKQYVNYDIRLYAIDLPASTYYLGITHKGIDFDGKGCYVMAYSVTTWVNEECIPY